MQPIHIMLRNVKPLERQIGSEIYQFEKSVHSALLLLFLIGVYKEDQFLYMQKISTNL